MEIIRAFAAAATVHDVVAAMVLLDVVVIGDALPRQSPGQGGHEAPAAAQLLAQVPARGRRARGRAHRCGAHDLHVRH